MQKVKDTARVAREDSVAMKTTSYECGVLEMETRLAEEVARVCRDYCPETWRKRLTGRESLLTPSWRGLKTSSSRRISKKFQQCSLHLLLTLSLLLNSSLSPKPFLLMSKSQHGLEKVRRVSHRRRPKTTRIPLWSRMWSPSPKKQSPGPRLGIPNPRQLILRETPTQQRPIYRDFFSYLFACIFLLLWCFHHCF